MPDHNGNFKGFSVSKVYPGHRDYVEPPKVLHWREQLQTTYVPIMDHPAPESRKV